MLRKFLVALCLLTCLVIHPGAARLPVAGDWVDIWVSVGSNPQMITGDVTEVNWDVGIIQVNASIEERPGVYDLKNRSNILIGVGSIVLMKIVGD